MNQSQIRNFAIIAHIDHGKSTLSDRFLELTNTVPHEKMQEQFLDRNPISRERGITIKLAPVRMNYTLDAKRYILNLIDTPGHMDFSYEVSRTLAACEGAILLVDATQGVQAQTVAHLNTALREGLVIIPAVNKIDLEGANPKGTAAEIMELTSGSEDDIIFVSAKTGQNVEELLRTVITKIPPPQGNEDAPLRALIFDALYDEHKGTVVFVRIMDGMVNKTDRISFLGTHEESGIIDLGYLSPKLVSADALLTGEIGYIATGIKDIRKARVGDTITVQSSKLKVQSLNIEALPGYQSVKPMVFFGVYPKDKDDYIKLREALSKLSLNDASLSIEEEQSSFLGSGFRVGFLGLLHAQIAAERLATEAGIDPLLVTPAVLYKEENGLLKEPYMKLTIYSPAAYIGGIMEVCQRKRGKMIDMKYPLRSEASQGKRIIFIYEMPYSMMIRGLIPELKSVSSGFATVDYELLGYRQADIMKLDILINNEPIDVLSEYVYKDDAQIIAREKVEKLKETLPRAQVRQVIQAVVGAKVLSRSEIPPFRKDVLAKMSGGDRTRKDKLLEKQKKGKKKLLGNVRVKIPQEALFNLAEQS